MKLNFMLFEKLKIIIQNWNNNNNNIITTKKYCLEAQKSCFSWHTAKDFLFFFHILLL